MFGGFKNWFAPAANPIGVDFGSDCLRMAQVQRINGEYRLIAAASRDIPSHVRHDGPARTDFFIEAVRELLSEGRFKGRRAILGLPSSSMFIQHLRMPRMDDEALKKALPWEARGKLPIDPSHAVLRHLVAGDIYQDQEPKAEVILMAAARERVNQMIATASRAKLDVEGINVEPQATIDCFANIFRRKSDADTTICFVDIGASGTRAIIARGMRILFARNIGVGGDQFTRATAASMGIAAEQARLLRIQLAFTGNEEPPVDRRAPVEAPHKESPANEVDENNSFALLSASRHAHAAAQESAGAAVMTPPGAETAPRAVTANPDDSSDQFRRVMRACSDPLGKLVEELNLCRRYYEATFPGKPVDRLVFIGGEARHRALCQHVAQEMSLVAQLGDPLARMNRDLLPIDPESGLDPRQPQPAWTVAIGLSMGGADASNTRT